MKFERWRTKEVLHFLLMDFVVIEGPCMMLLVVTIQIKIQISFPAWGRSYKLDVTTCMTNEVKPACYQQAGLSNWFSWRPMDHNDNQVGQKKCKNFLYSFGSHLSIFILCILT